MAAGTIDFTPFSIHSFGKRAFAGCKSIKNVINTKTTAAGNFNYHVFLWSGLETFEWKLVSKATGGGDAYYDYNDGASEQALLRTEGLLSENYSNSELWTAYGNTVGTTPTLPTGTLVVNTDTFKTLKIGKQAGSAATSVFGYCSFAAENPGLITADLSEFKSRYTNSKHSTEGWFQYRFFYNCPNLTNVIFNSFDVENTARFGFECFKNTAFNVNLENWLRLKYIDKSAFENNATINNVPRSCAELVRIEDSAFKNCTSVNSIIVTDCPKLFLLGKNAFENCGALEIDFSNCTALKHVKKDAFKTTPTVSIKFDNCTNLTNLWKCSEACNSLKTFSAKNCGALSEHCKDEGQFEGLINLETVDFSGAHIGKIKKSTFKGCESLTSFNITDGSCTGFEKSACEACIALPTIVGWDGQKATYTTIDDRAFYNCQQLNVDLTNMPVLEQFGDHSFYQCPMLATVVSNCPELVKIGNYAFASDAQFDGVDLNGSTKIKEIGESACEHTKSTTVNLSNSTVEKINNRAWSNSGIQTLNLNNCTALELIGGQAFNTCVDLAIVTTNNVPSLKKIGVSAFCTDYNIKNIDLSSANLQLVEEHAFDYCNSLEEFKIKCNDNCVFEAKCFAGFRQTDSPYPPHTHVPSQQPLNIYIYANVPAARPFDTAVMNAVNNENISGLVTIHLSSAAESLYKAAATSAKAASPGMDGPWHMVYYWILPDGSIIDATNYYSAVYEYATTSDGAPSVVFDL